MTAAAQVECGGCGTDDFSSSDEWLEDEEPWPAGCQWNVIGPARLGYDQFADWVDRFGMAWRLDVITAPRPDATVQHYTANSSPGRPGINRQLRRQIPAASRSRPPRSQTDLDAADHAPGPLARAAASPSDRLPAAPSGELLVVLSDDLPVS